MKYRLFECCRLVRGHGRSCIYDLQRDRLLFVPNFITDLVNKRNEIDPSELVAYDVRDQKTLRLFINQLIREEILFEVNDLEAKNFPLMDLSWDYFAHISNAIVFLCVKNISVFSTIIQNLIEMNCRNVQFIVSEDCEFDKIKELHNLMNTDNFEYFEFIFPKSIVVDEHDMLTWVENNFSIGIVIVANHNYNKVLNSLNEGRSSIIFTSEKISFTEKCGNVHPHYFCKTIECFTESQRHNTCLNRKVCIDAEGNIKNCPAMVKSYGNIKDTTLEEAINKPGFKDLWYICKDQIDVCKDCEFRYMCTDCRCFIKDPDNIYSQPAKCPYNPYICLWEGQEGYVPVEECGTYSRETGFVPDKKRIKELNKRIWGEE